MVELHHLSITVLSSHIVRRPLHNLRRRIDIHFLGVRIHCSKLLDSDGVYRAGDDHQDGDEDLEGVDRVTAPLIIV